MSYISFISEPEKIEMEHCAEELIDNNVFKTNPALMQLAHRIQVTINALRVFRESGIHTKNADELLVSLNDLCLVFVDTCSLMSLSK
jgi:hypothetical protein